MKRRGYWILAGVVLLMLTVAIAEPFRVRAQGQSLKGQNAWTDQVEHGLDLERMARQWEVRGDEIDSRVGEELAQMEENLAEAGEGMDELCEQQAEELANAFTDQSDELESQAEALAERVGQAGKHRLHMAWSDEGGWLGIEIAELTQEKAGELKLPSPEGVLVVEVVKDSPAAKAGLKADDVITSYNGEKVEGSVQLRRLVRETPLGRTVQITVWRDGRSENLSAQVSNHREQWEDNDHVNVFGPSDFDFNFDFGPMVAPFGSLRPLLGIHAEDISGQLAGYFGVPGGQGVLVKEVNAGSAAEKAGLKAGDVIVRVNGQAITTSHELRSQLRGKRDQKSATLGVIRQGKEVSLTVEIERARAPKPASTARSVTL